MSSPYSSDECLDYTNAAIALSEGLKVLLIICLKYSGSDAPLSQSSYKKITLQHSLLVDRLKKFPSLEELRIKEADDQGRSISHYNYVLNQCLPAVKKFTFDATRRNTDLHVNQTSSSERITPALATAPPIPNTALSKVIEISSECNVEEESASYIM